MTKQNIDSTQPESDAQTEDLTIVRPGERDHIEVEEVDRNDPPVADIARELPQDAKDAVRLEGDWAGDAGRHDGDDAQEVTEGPASTGKA